MAAPICAEPTPGQPAGSPQPEPGSGEPATPAPSDLPVLVYDGDCGFCTTSARWLERRIGGAGRIASSQELGAVGLSGLGLTVDDAARAAWWVDADGGTWCGHLAVARALGACPGVPGRLGAAAARPPLSWLGALLYPLVVRWRHRLPGATDSCRV